MSVGLNSYELEPPAFRRQLVDLRGIGDWTAHYISMRALGDPDAMPAADLVVRKMLGKGRLLTPKEVERRSRAWRPWRAYALMHLWAAATDTATIGEAK